MTTLITYASAHGSTQEIAERIRDIINAKIAPHRTECLPIDQVADLSKYSYVVVGSAVHGVQWLPVATSFLHKNSAALSKLPVWAFSVGSRAGYPRTFKNLGPQQEDALTDAVNSDVKVQGHAMFSGKVLKEHLDSQTRCWWGCLGGKWGDFRDWEGIEAWATEVGDAILKRQEGRGV